jgi:ankyrin repeat protein
MKKKTVFGAVLFVLLFVQAQAVFAEYEADFLKEVGKNNFSGMERILQRRASQMNLAHCMVQILANRVNGFSSSNTMRVMQLLVQHGANVNGGTMIPIGGNYYNWVRPLEAAIQYNHPIEVVQFLINSGAYLIKDSNERYAIAGDGNGTGYLPEAIRNVAVRNLLLERGTDLNGRTHQGRTALMFEAEAGNFNNVRFLVENGARVNLRANDGSTAASLAYEKGEIEIYNYLKENGAIDFEPRQVVQPAAPAPSSTTNVYVQPSVPAQSAPAPSTPTLQTGRYAWSNSGTNMNMTFNVGIVTAYINNSPIGVWHGTYRINGS